MTWNNVEAETRRAARLASGYAPEEATEDWRALSITQCGDDENYYYALLELKGYSEFGLTDYHAIPADIRRTKVVLVHADNLKNL